MRKWLSTFLVLAGLWPGWVQAQTGDYQPLPVGAPDVPPPLSNDAFPSPSQRRVVIPPPPPLQSYGNSNSYDPNSPPAPPRSYRPIVPIPDDGLATTPSNQPIPTYAPPAPANWGPPSGTPTASETRYQAAPAPVANPVTPAYEPANTSTPPVYPLPEDDFTTQRQPAENTTNEPVRSSQPPPPSGLFVQKVGPEAVNVGSP
ncbi:MAG: hypothetical protein AB7K24_29465, partial [Gemmataceae bacterium]